MLAQQATIVTKSKSLKNIDAYTTISDLVFKTHKHGRMNYKDTKPYISAFL